MEATIKTETKDIAPANVEGDWEDENTTPESTEGLTKKQKENLKKKQKRKEKKDAAKNETDTVSIDKPLEEIKEEVEGQETAEPLTGTKSEPANEFEKELAWCIYQLRLGLSNNGVTKDQLRESMHVINTLESQKVPLIKKRHLMKVVFGDYRKLMKTMT